MVMSEGCCVFCSLQRDEPPLALAFVLGCFARGAMPEERTGGASSEVEEEDVDDDDDDEDDDEDEHCGAVGLGPDEDADGWPSTRRRFTFALAGRGSSQALQQDACGALWSVHRGHAQGSRS